MNHSKRLLLISLSLLVSACASTPNPRAPSEDPSWWMEFPSAAELPPALRAGLTPPRRKGQPVATGDRLLFELIFDKNGETNRRFLAFEVTGPHLVDGNPRIARMEFTSSPDSSIAGVPAGETIHEVWKSPLHKVLITLFDEEGLVLRTSQTVVSEIGVHSSANACRILEGKTDEMSKRPLEKEEYFAITRPTTSLFAMATLAGGDELLSDLLWDVIDPPSAFSFLMTWGVDLFVTPNFEQGTRPTARLADLDAFGEQWAFPIDLFANEQLAIYLDLLVTEPLPPLVMTGGVIALHGKHPTKDIQVRARLIGASTAESAEVPSSE